MLPQKQDVFHLPPPYFFCLDTQVIFRMTSTLVQFGCVLLVVMVGFAMALHALFRGSDSRGETFGEAMLGLFKALLGDNDYFDEFSGGRYDDVASILLVAYLLIMTIMLLNLLIAVLSTEHDEVHDKVEGAFRVSKARIIGYYQTVVQEGLLPAPFNLLQPVASTMMLLPRYLAAWCRQKCTCPSVPVAPAASSAPHGYGVRLGKSRERHGQSTWRMAYSSASNAFGEIVFSLLLGSVAVTVGALLWIGSALPIFPYAQYTWWARYRMKAAYMGGLNTRSVLLRLSLVSAWCIVGGPLMLLLLWFWSGVVLLLNLLFPYFNMISDQDRTNGGGEGPRREATMSTVESMLRKVPNGVGADQLQNFLRDPMGDRHVRQDEKERQTTVEHMKLLRHRLEMSRKNDLHELRSNVASKEELAKLQTHVQGLRGNVASREELDRLRFQVQAIDSKLDEILEIARGGT